MLTRHAYGSVVWIDLLSPTQNEIRLIVEEFEVDALTAEELLFPTVRPRLELKEHYFYAVFHFPALRHTHKTLEQEIDFIVGERFIITARYQEADAVHAFAHVFNTDSRFNEETIGAHASHVFFSLMRRLYRSVEREVAAVHDALRDIENDIFKGREMAMVAALSFTGRDLLNLRQTLEPHRDILHDLDVRGNLMLPRELMQHVKALLNEYYRVHNHIMRHVETMHELRETNNSLVYTRQNEVMRILTIMAFVTFPLSLVAGIFGMNTEFTPIVGNPLDFWIIVGVMVFGTVFMFWYFRHKKWI